MKPIQSSLTVWANVVLLAIGVVPLVGTFVKLVAPQTAMIVDSAVIMLGGILNLVLRIFFTGTPLTASGLRRSLKEQSGTKNITTAS